MQSVAYQIFYTSSTGWWPWSPWIFQDETIAKVITAILQMQYPEHQFQVNSTTIG